MLCPGRFSGEVWTLWSLARVKGGLRLRAIEVGPQLWVAEGFEEALNGGPRGSLCSKGDRGALPRSFHLRYK